MTVAVVLPVSGDAQLLEAQRVFHDAAGATGDAAEAEWVIEADEGEFWWPHGGSLDEVLRAVPARYSTVQAVVRDLYALPGGEPVTERATYRFAPHAASRHTGSRKLVSRLSGGPLLRGWYPIEVLRLAPGEPPLPAERVERGLADGTLHLDTRVRDALRSLAQGRGLAFPRPDVVDDARLALDVAVLGEADVLRAQERLDELEGRLAMVESTLSARLERKLRALLGSRR